MHRLYYSCYDNGRVELAIENDVSDYANIFTVIVGKNGVGKSRLLSQIAKSCIENNEILSELQSYNINEQSPKVIAVSTSPFDKFPSNRKATSSPYIDTNYRYVGMRGEGPFGISSAVSLLSSAAKGWLEKLVSLENSANLLDVFYSLDFEPRAEFVFKSSYIGITPLEYENAYKHKDELLEEVIQLHLERNIILDRRYIEQLAKYSKEVRYDIYNAMVEVNHFESGRKAVTLSVDFTNGESLVGSYHASSRFAKAILRLISVGFMRLMDMRLIKNSYGPMSLKRASSGEQCLLVMMLGIAGHITDNSIILIDEPEISLHPRWQEEFILMITRAFSSYKGCQFIIATHSPQIISHLPDEGCYITSLSNNTIYKAKYFSKRSADYQLAELFDAPGIMNEYIARLAFSLLSKVKSAKYVTDENWNELHQLQHLIQNVDRHDPIKELVESIYQVCEIYAKN
ncbi:AAA family ATPase [Dickeya dadantii]|uniref:AAA family ATPase n=1 Tax=Dickeya dadantii TaxID=204038 RepID=UPI001495C9D7|nr:ATP-binding protein [Dickeya dadantii]NPE55988.1 AAA family ATPase [Dickeya dadantii]NPE68082.1 AAA family ATPase [Dickeya dadantii]